MSANMCVDLCPYILDLPLFINTLYSAQILSPKTMTTMVINHFRHDERHLVITDATTMSIPYVFAGLTLIAVHGRRLYLLVIIKYILPFHLTSVVRVVHEKLLMPHFTCIFHPFRFTSPFRLRRLAIQMRKCITMHRHYKSTFNFWTSESLKIPISERSKTG